MKPRLSIITINRNNAEGLRKTIESVIRQTSIDFEYIVIDGDSTDDSVEVIKEYRDRITYWVSEKDFGIYNAMNKGIKQAVGEYCQFLNSGDILVDNFVIEKMINDSPNSSIIIGKMFKEISRDKVCKGEGSIIKESISMFTFYRGTLNHSSAFIRRSLFEKYGLYDETLKIVSDWKWYLIAVGLNSETVSYRDIDVTLFDMNGISTTNKQLETQERRKVLEELIPSNILADYDSYGFAIQQSIRIDRYTLMKKAVWLIDRLLFMWEKLKG